MRIESRVHCYLNRADGDPRHVGYPLPCRRHEKPLPKLISLSFFHFFSPFGWERRAMLLDACTQTTRSRQHTESHPRRDTDHALVIAPTARGEVAWEGGDTMCTPGHRGSEVLWRWRCIREEEDDDRHA